MGLLDDAKSSVSKWFEEQVAKNKAFKAAGGMGKSNPAMTRSMGLLPATGLLEQEGDAAADIYGGASDRLYGMKEVGASMLSGAVAQPVSGLGGLMALASGRNPTKTINSLHGLLTYQPQTEFGREYANGLARLMAPVAEISEDARGRLGDGAYRLTGSPAAAALAYSTPEALAAYLGARKVMTPKTAAAPLNTGAYKGQRGAAGFARDKPFTSWSVDSDDIYDAAGDVVGSDDYVLIDKVFVPEGMRGKGVGRKVLADALREARARHPELPVKLAALPDKGAGALDMNELVSWYERMGFDVTDTSGHAVIMQHDGDLSRFK